METSAGQSAAAWRRSMRCGASTPGTSDGRQNQPTPSRSPRKIAPSGASPSAAPSISSGWPSASASAVPLASSSSTRPCGHRRASAAASSRSRSPRSSGAWVKAKPEEEKEGSDIGASLPIIGIACNRRATDAGPAGGARSDVAMGPRSPAVLTASHCALRRTAGHARSARRCGNQVESGHAQPCRLQQRQGLDRIVTRPGGPGTRRSSALAAPRHPGLSAACPAADAVRRRCTAHWWSDARKPSCRWGRHCRCPPALPGCCRDA